MKYNCDTLKETQGLQTPNNHRLANFVKTSDKAKR